MKTTPQLYAGKNEEIVLQEGYWRPRGYPFFFFLFLHPRTPVMKTSLLSGVTLTSKLPGGSLTSSTKAGFCFISYARQTSFTALVNFKPVKVKVGVGKGRHGGRISIRKYGEAGLTPLRKPVSGNNHAKLLSWSAEVSSIYAPRTHEVRRDK